MKKFVFNLESLLTLRDWEEQNARIALTEANAQIERIRMRISDLEASIDTTFSSWNGDTGRRFSSMDRLGISAQVAQLEAEAESARSHMKNAESTRAKAMKELQEATKRRRVITNLKDKRKLKHDAEIEKQETAEIEDIFNARRKQL